MRILALDPGKTTGCVLVEFGHPLPLLVEAWEVTGDVSGMLGYPADILAVEMPESAGLGRTDGGGVGMRVQPLLDTAVLCGRILEAWERDGGQGLQITRRDVVRFFGVHKGKGNRDSRVRAQMLLMYGGERRALGVSKERGPLWPLRSSGGHMWAAMALALTAEAPARLRMRGAA